MEKSTGFGQCYFCKKDKEFKNDPSYIKIKDAERLVCDDCLNLVKKVLELKEESIEWIEINKKRLGFHLNPICPVCGRVMRTKDKHKTYGSYYCVCSPNLILSLG